jgi:hypothetical protein
VYSVDLFFLAQSACFEKKQATGLSSQLPESGGFFFSLRFVDDASTMKLTAARSGRRGEASTD